MTDTTQAREALLNYQQADMDGIMVLTSRQAIHEVIDAYDALAAKLAEVEAERDEARKIADHDKELWLAAEARAEAAEEDRDDALIALASARKQLERYVGEAEAALVAAYRLALADAAYECQGTNRGNDPVDTAEDIRALPTPTAADLLARIKETAQ